MPGGGMRANSHLPKPGAGRPLGSVSKKTKFIREASDRAIAGGISPLEVMLEGMRFYHARAVELLIKIEGAVAKNKISEETMLNFIKLANTRAAALEHAVAAAPYVHARLSAIAVSGSVDVRHELPQDVGLEVALELYDGNLKTFPAPVKVIEHKDEKAV